MTGKNYSPNGVRLVPIIEMSFARGEGIEEDPVRTVYRYYSKNGKLLAEFDAFKNDQAEDGNDL